MFAPGEREEIRNFVHQELVHIEDQISRCAGGYDYLCLIAGSPTFCHQPVGPVIRRIHHPHPLGG